MLFLCLCRVFVPQSHRLLWAITPSVQRRWPKPYACVLIDALVCDPRGNSSFPHVLLLTFTWPIRCAMNLYIVPLSSAEHSCQATLHSALHLPSIKIHHFPTRLANGFQITHLLCITGTDEESHGVYPNRWLLTFANGWSMTLNYKPFVLPDFSAACSRSEQQSHKRAVKRLPESTLNERSPCRLGILGPKI